MIFWCWDGGKPNIYLKLIIAKSLDYILLLPDIASSSLKANQLNDLWVHFSSNSTNPQPLGSLAKRRPQPPPHNPYPATHPSLILKAFFLGDSLPWELLSFLSATGISLHLPACRCRICTFDVCTGQPPNLHKLYYCLQEAHDPCLESELEISTRGQPWSANIPFSTFLFKHKRFSPRKETSHGAGHVNSFFLLFNFFILHFCILMISNSVFWQGIKGLPPEISSRTRGEPCDSLPWPKAWRTLSLHAVLICRFDLGLVEDNWTQILESNLVNHVLILPNVNAHHWFLIK